MAVEYTEPNPEESEPKWNRPASPGWFWRIGVYNSRKIFNLSGHHAPGTKAA